MINDGSRCKAAAGFTATATKVTSPSLNLLEKPARSSNQMQGEAEQLNVSHEHLAVVPSVSATSVHSQLSPGDNEKEMFPLRSPGPASEINVISRAGKDGRRGPSLSSVPRSMSSSSSSPSSGNNLVSSTPKLANSSSSRGSSISPSPRSQEPKSSSAQLRTSTRSSKPTIKESTAHGNRLIQRSCSMPHRDIFSPIPSEKVKEQQSPRESDDYGSSGDGYYSFPSIKVEDCDEVAMAAGLKGLKTMKKSATVFGDMSYESSDREQITGGQNMTSLNVPSPFIKWRTAEGRLIAAINDELPVAGSLSRLLSLSEGSIPLTISADDDSRDHRGGSTENRTDQTHTNTSSLKPSRHMSHATPAEPRNTSSRHNVTHTHQLTTTTRNTNQVSKTKLQMTSGQLLADTKGKQTSGLHSRKGN